MSLSSEEAEIAIKEKLIQIIQKDKKGKRMWASSMLRLPNIRPTPISSNQNPSEPDTKPVPQARKLKGSARLNRWSRARTIRSGRKLDRPDQQVQVLEAKRPPVEATESELNSVTKIDGDDDVELRVGKSIYMISDGTGWTAEHSVNAALGQFEHCLVDRGCPVNTHLFSGVNTSFSPT